MVIFRAFSKFAVIAWLGAGALVPPAFAAAAPENARRACLAGHLARFGFVQSTDRSLSATEVWNLYKNNDHFAAWLIEQKSLSSPEEALSAYAAALTQGKAKLGIPKPRIVQLGEKCEGEKCVWLTEALQQPKVLESLVAGASQYDALVLGLRKGDTVLFGKEKLRLGNFLGAGNASHVYELADFPERAVKIPFMTTFLRTGDPQADLLAARGWVRKLVEDKDKYPVKNRIEIFNHGKNHEYVIVTRIKGTIDGENFVKNLLAELPAHPGESVHNYILRLPKNSPYAKRLRALYTLIPVDPEDYNSSRMTGDWITVARQLWWDHDKSKWIWADWE